MSIHAPVRGPASAGPRQPSPVGDEHTMLHPRHSRLISLCFLVVVVMLASVAWLTVTGLAARLGAVALCLALGVVYALGQGAAATPRRAAAYFLVQAILALGLLALSGGRDSFNFPFYVLGLQAMLLLAPRPASLLIIVFYLASSLLIWSSRGSASAVSLIFNVAVYFFTGVFGYVLRQAEAARQANETLLAELRASQRQVQELAVFEERNRLARDLHDSAKQRAFALSAQLDAVRSLLRRDPAAAEVQLQRAEQVADHLRQELANLILQLRPPEMEAGGLPDALRRYAAEWAQACSLAVEVSVTGERPLPAEIEQALFRVAQEALANVGRHSRAQAAQVSLRYAPDRVALTIADAGLGFDSALTQPGLGTRSMQARVARLPGGQFRLTSQPGSGTQVTVECLA